MTDTAGYSDIVFGLFWLLGYQFSPRLADAGEARFRRIDSDADYGVLNGLARQQVNTSLIEEQWRCGMTGRMPRIAMGQYMDGDWLRGLTRQTIGAAVWMSFCANAIWDDLTL